MNSDLSGTADHIHVYRRLTYKDRDRPALTAAVTSAAAGEVLVVTKLERLAR
ncbi:hypothetical protein GS480_17760 [Rhodococcus hoagii]|nr:hypothetical protein [Prescottella equi]